MERSKGLHNLIYKLYEKKGYFKNYGLDISITVFIVWIGLSIATYISIQSTLGQVQADWAINRCKPLYIPFAGWIMPQPDKTNIEATEENLQYCLQSDFSSIGDLLLMPIQFTVFLITTTIDGIVAFINSFMEFLEDLAKDLGILFEMLYQFLLLFIIPLMTQFLHFRDILTKTQGVLYAAWEAAVVNSNFIMVSGLLNLVNASNAVLQVIVFATLVVFMACFAIYITGTAEITVGGALVPPVVTAPAGFALIASGLATYGVATVAAIVLIAFIALIVVWAVYINQLNDFVQKIAGQGGNDPPNPPSSNYMKGVP